MFLSNMKALLLVIGVPCLCVAIYSNVFQKPRHDPLAFVGKGDPAMAAARAQGQATLPVFLQHLNSPASDESHFGVKFRLDPRHAVGAGGSGNFATPGDEADEFIWANKLKLTADGKALSGAIDDDPRSTGFYSGQAVVIPLQDVVDWGYMKGGVMQGNYSTKALIAKMPPDEAAKVKKVLGWQ